MAIGAATSDPCPASSSKTVKAISGLSNGAKTVNQACGSVSFPCDYAVPVLHPTRISVVSGRFSVVSFESLLFVLTDD